MSLSVFSVTPPERRADDSGLTTAIRELLCLVCVMRVCLAARGVKFVSSNVRNAPFWEIHSPPLVAALGVPRCCIFPFPGNRHSSVLL